MLGFSELVETLLAQFATVAAHLHAPERPRVVIGERIVDPERARLHLLVKLLHLAGVVGIEVRAQAEGAVVGQLYRLVEVAIRHDGNGWTKRLLAHDTHRVINARKHRRLVEEAARLPRWPLPAREYTRRCAR